MATFETLLQQLGPAKVMDAVSYLPIDLSVSNKELATIEVGNTAEFSAYITDFLKKNRAEAAFGGYNEERNLYQRSTIFNNLNSEERNIHIGLDIWIAAGTPILAALDGVVHSFNNNIGMGNYGPTIILEHAIENEIFYSLYGHLAVESIEKITIGQRFKKGKQLAKLGDATVNGDYPPHLHFQIIKDIAGHFGDYPGVCTKSDRDYFLANCPDPNILLHLNTQPS